MPCYLHTARERLVCYSAIPGGTSRLNYQNKGNLSHVKFGKAVGITLLYAKMKFFDRLEEKFFIK